MPKKHEVSGSSIADGSSGETSSPSTSESADNNDSSSQDTEQALYCAVFDGHNGAQVSTFLSSHLHERLLSVSQSEANSIVCSYRTLGGYMRRYKGGLLAPLVDPPAPRRTKTIARELKVEEERRARQDRGEVEPEEEEKQAVEEPTDGAKQMRKDQPPWNVLQRIEAAFLKTDLEIIDNDKE